MTSRMTSRVTVDANCADDKQVQVLLVRSGPEPIKHLLEDGETKEMHVYGEIMITVTEVDKPAAVAEVDPE